MAPTKQKRGLIRDSGYLAKRYLKFLSVCKDPAATARVLKTSPDVVIKRICDAALNAANGDIKLSRKQKRDFKRNVELFQTLVNKQIPLDRKRRILSNQRGSGLALLPAIISTVLGAVGSLLFQKP